VTKFFTLAAAAAAALAVATHSAPAQATCRSTFIDGRQGQLCDNSLDIPAIPTLGIPPLVPPSITPIQVPVIPPIGTTSCRQAQVWNGSAYQWRTVCS
jgi:hypothetical protein